MSMKQLPIIALVAASLCCASAALAGTKYQTSLVPNVAGTVPGFASSGASIKLDDKLAVKGKLKTVVDGSGNRITTDTENSADDYKVEIDLAVGTTSATISISFDLKNGNGKFQEDISGDAVFAGATSGDAVAIEAVRVLDANGTVIGVGGVSVK